MMFLSLVVGGVFGVVGFGSGGDLGREVVEARFLAVAVGNPYDGRLNDARAVFQVGGERLERLAFWDGDGWVARAVVGKGERPAAQFLLNGRPLGEARSSFFRPYGPSGGRVRISGEDGTRFVLESGEAFWPIGTNSAWSLGDEMSVGDYLRELSRHGGNWGRVWACHWDGKNPYWVEGEPPSMDGVMRVSAIDRWEAIVSAAEEAGVRFQMVFFHHGPYSSTVNSNWGEHPWNAANGGWLLRPDDFFTDERARQLAKDWLRYAVARWGHSASVMAWELFNEVEWCDPARRGEWGTIAAWHGEMADYLRSIDPYETLVTTSSELGHPELWEKMDFYQPHGYPPSVEAMLAGARAPSARPFFFGEFGGATFDAATERDVVRDGIWTSMLLNHSGAACYWYWDRTQNLGLWDEFSKARAMLDRSGLARRWGARPADLKVETATRGDLVLRPGMGWGRTTQNEFELPRDGTPDAMGRVAGYFNAHAGGNSELNPRPWVFRFTSAEPVVVRVELGEVSEGGARVVARVNGRVVSDSALAGKTTDAGDVSFTVPAGRGEVILESLGPDWVVVQGLSFSGLAPGVRGRALVEPGFGMLRLTGAASAVGTEVGLRVLGLEDGEYRMEVLDLDTGSWSEGQVRVREGRLSPGVRMGSDDLAVLLTRR